MVASTTQKVAENNSDQNFRDWAKAISDAIVASGIIRTADTGQINFTTVVRPASANTAAGYEIFRFNDTLQSTAPVFFKIEYGSGPGSTFHPAVWLTVGSGSDGAGNLTGQVSSRIQTASTSSSTALQTCVFSGTTSRFACGLFISGGSGVPFVFTLERTKDNAGADNGTGVMFASFGTSTRRNQFTPATGTIPATQTDSGILAPIGVTSSSFGADVIQYPNFFFDRGQILNPGITHFSYFNADIAATTQAPVSVYGANRNYYFLGGNTPVSARGGISGTSICLLYE